MSEAPDPKAVFRERFPAQLNRPLAGPWRGARQSSTLRYAGGLPDEG
ncbi:MAG: hypothetical protein H6Q91_2341 [Deltaproteobacteria bacterium]|nr:hypothetical protein [Deltaproteobacteria bacterium]